MRPEDFVIWSDYLEDLSGLSNALFGDEPPEIIHEGATMADILRAAGVFESKSQARKNYRLSMDIPFGFSEHGPFGKLRRRVFVWYPVPPRDA